MIYKKEKYLEWAVCFWIGIGLMSIINIWKIIYTQKELSYDWIMFGISIIFIVICTILIRKNKR